MSASQPALPASTAPNRQPAINGMLASILRSPFHGLAIGCALLAVLFRRQPRVESGDRAS